MKIKRILSILIVFLLLFTVFTPSMAFADNSETIKTEETNIDENQLSINDIKNSIKNTIEDKFNINNIKSNNINIQADIQPADNATINKSGTNGECTWELYTDGTLIIKPTNGVSGTLDNLNSTSNVPWYGYRNLLRQVKVEQGVISNNNCSYMFYNCEYVKLIDINNFDTYNTNNMYYMFNGCKSLESLDVSNFDTSNVTNMYGMFGNCSSLESLDVNNFDTSNVTDMGTMFVDCTNIKSIEGLENFNISNVTNISGMFSSCKSLKSLDLSSWNTSNITLGRNVFYNCTSLKVLNLSGWDMTQMCYSSGNVNKFLEGAYNLNTLIIGSKCFLAIGTYRGYINEEYTNSYYYSIPSGPWINTTTNEIITEEKLIQPPENEIYIYKKNIIAQLYEDGTLIIKTGEDIESGHGNIIEQFINSSAIFSNNDNIINVIVEEEINLNLNQLFYNCINLESIENIENLNTSNATSMYGMFYNCNSLESLDVSNFNTSNVTNMTQMFYNCSKLTSLDVSNFNTSNATSMYGMFYNCNSLESLNVSNFDTSNVTTMESMFNGCSSLESLNVSNFDTSNVTNMGTMFKDCSLLEEIIGIEDLNTSNVTNMYQMFSGCSLLESLDLSGWNTSNVTTMRSMFYNCETLKILNIGMENVSNVKYFNDLITGCFNLEELTLPDFDETKITWASGIYNQDKPYLNFFKDCTSLYKITFIGNFVPLYQSSTYNSITLSYIKLPKYSWKINGQNYTWSEYNYSNEIYQSTIANQTLIRPYCAVLYTNGILVFQKNFQYDYSYGTPIQKFYDFGYYRDPTYGNERVLPGYIEYADMITKIIIKDNITVQNFENMFKDLTNVTEIYGLNNLHYQKIGHWYQYSYKFIGRNLDLSHMTNLSLIEIGNEFNILNYDIYENNHGDISDNIAYIDGGHKSILPDNIKWIKEDHVYGPYDSLELSEIYETNHELYGDIWIRYNDGDMNEINLIPGEGMVIKNKIYYDKGLTFTLPEATQYGYTFIGWNTKEDGSGTMYLPNIEYEDIIEEGYEITLYAQYEAWIWYYYTIEIYEEKAETIGEYTLIGTTEERIHDIDANEPITIVPTQNITGGFITPDSQIVTISPNNDTIIKFYYNRIRYNLAFNGNGNTLANYPTIENIAANYGIILPGSDLVETTPFIWRDTRNREYTPGQLFYYNPLQNGETITLYAVWNTTHDESTSQEGEVEIKIHAGDIINFPSLPAGTRYEIEEINLPDGWSMVDGYNLTGTISPNVNIRAEIINVYYANTEATLVVYKNLIGKQLEANMFSFDLVEYSKPMSDNPFSGRTRYIDTAMNGIPYINPDDMDNPFYGMGAIIFNIPLEQEGTYYYGIRENIGHDNTIVYDENESHITVTVTDNGDGTMSVNANYDKLVFTNRMADTMLPIMKTVSGGSSNAIFTFKVELYEGGTSDELVPLTEEYTVLYADGRTSTVSHNGTIELRGGESCIIRGLPYMSKYKISEINTAGYSLIGSTNTSGTSEIFDTIDEDGYTFDERYAVKFENAYSSSGSIVLSATKQIIGRELEANKYQFELKDISGTVIQTTYAQADGSIEFAPIYYGLSDNGSVYTYFISEVIGEDEDIMYDQNTISVFVVVNDNGAGTMIAEATYEQEPIFTNKVLIPITIKNNVYGKYNNENFHYTVEFSNTTLGVIYYTLNDSEEKQMVVIKDGKFEFDLKKDETITIYDIYAGTTIEITQNEYENFSTSVNNEPGYTYIIESLVNSENINYLNANDIALPNTGSNMSIIIMSIGGLFIICGMTFIMIKKKKITVN